MIRETIKIRHAGYLPALIEKLTAALMSIPEKSRATADYDMEDEEVSYYREETDADRKKKADNARKLIANLEKQKADAEALLEGLT